MTMRKGTFQNCVDIVRDFIRQGMYKDGARGILDE